jgi:hypothetical protein
MHGHIVRALYQYLIEEMGSASLLPSGDLATLVPFVKKVREEFRIFGKDTAEVNKAIYHSSIDEDAMLKIAYAFVYFPPYAFQSAYAWFLLFDTAMTLLETTSELQIISIGGGPLPELIGLVDAICRRIDPKKCALKTVRWLSLDVNDDWYPFAQNSASVARRILSATGFTDVVLDLTFEHFDVSESIGSELLHAFKKQTYVISQNLLNEIPNSSRSIVIRNFHEIANAMAPGSALVFSDLIGYEQAVLDTMKVIATSLSGNSQWLLLQERDFPKRAWTQSAVRSPFWGARAQEVNLWSPIPSAVNNLIGFNDDGGSRAKRNLWCGFRVLVN